MQATQSSHSGHTKFSMTVVVILYDIHTELWNLQCVGKYSYN